MRSHTAISPAATRRAGRNADRRQQIIAATIESISTTGFADTTLATVAGIAGVSQGIVVFHFKNKEALLVETLQHLADEYQRTWRKALRKAADDDVMDCILALATSDFDPKLCNRKKLAVWYAFVGESKTRSTYNRICASQDAERFAILESRCEELLEMNPSDSCTATTLATSIDAFSDGLWQRLHLSARTFKRSQALALMYHYLRLQFPDYSAAIEAHQAARH